MQSERNSWGWSLALAVLVCAAIMYAVWPRTQLEKPSPVTRLSVAVDGKPQVPELYWPEGSVLEFSFDNGKTWEPLPLNLPHDTYIRARVLR